MLFPEKMMIVCAGKTVILLESLLMKESKLLIYGTIGTTRRIERTNPSENNVWIVMILMVGKTNMALMTNVVMVLVIMRMLLLTSGSQELT